VKPVSVAVRPSRAEFMKLVADVCGDDWVWIKLLMLAVYNVDDREEMNSAFLSDVAFYQPHNLDRMLARPEVES